ncbi:response regulator transcription factor [Steroidobacter flavus]|uniref:Response regulator transcription factor n=1 Tax=Steroidobacter flavus TaxID=1842136 RepID=A0ABV8T061_9GAMM
MFVIASPDPDTLDRWRAGLGENASLIEVRRNDALRECVARLQPQLLLLDLRLARAVRPQDISLLSKASPATRIIVLADACNEDVEVALFRAGVRGVCPLHVSDDLLLRVTNAVLQGELWIRRALVPKLLEGFATDRHEAETGCTGRFAILTPRETEIARLIGQGVSNKRIARHLAIAEQTVKGHLTAIFRKIGVVDRTKLALLFAHR